MIEAKTYTFGELLEAVVKGDNQTKPKVDGKIIKTDAQNNEKAVNDIMKETSKYDGGQTNPKRNTNPEVDKDFNKTLLDLNYQIEPSEEYKERIKSQVKGYPSAENEKNTKIKEENKGVDFSGNEEFLKSQEEKNKDVTDRKAEIAHSGLASHNLPKEEFKDKTVFTEDKKMKQLKFSKSVFLTEEDVIKHVPDEYKVDGNKFYMKDAQGNQSLVECVKDSYLDYVHVNIVRTTNKKNLQEEFNRMQELAGYSPNNYVKGSVTENRANSDKDFTSILTELKKYEKEK